MLETKALNFHETDPKGKVGVIVTKDVETNINLAYSPGVAEPCTAIGKDPKDALKYTNLGNRVAIISNGTAILGLGKLNPIASKPVLEGKCALFKVLSGIDCTDLVINEFEAKKMADAIISIADSFSGIMLEDIAAPECFELEEILQKALDIPVFHDDQHGTAVVCVAALFNAIKKTGKRIQEMKVVCLGAGAAGLACLRLMMAAGIRDVIVFDSRGSIHKNRKDLNKYKESFAIDKEISIIEALDGADVFLGTSVGNALKAEWLAKMAKDPLILALANPIPEIMPDEALKVRPDALVCTGRSDYPNQVNNVFCFPYLFRILLEDRDIKLDDNLKLAVARAIASLAPNNSLMPLATDISLRYTLPGRIMKELKNVENHEFSKKIATHLLPVSSTFNPKQILEYGYYIDLGCDLICDSWGISKVKSNIKIVKEYSGPGLWILLLEGRLIVVAGNLKTENAVGCIIANDTIYFNPGFRKDYLSIFASYCALKLDLRTETGA